MNKQSKLNKIPFLITLTIVLGLFFVMAFPSFIPISEPTGTTPNSTVIIEYNITQDDSLTPSDITFSWDDVNTTIFNDSVILMMNFDNRSALPCGNGFENDSCVADCSYLIHCFNKLYCNRGLMINKGGSI